MSTFFKCRLLAKNGNNTNKNAAPTASETTTLESRVKYIEPPPGSNVAREIINSFKRNSDKILLVDGLNEGQQYSGQMLWEQTARLATGLMSHPAIKLSVGEPILLMCNHSVRVRILVLAALYTGASVMNTDTSGYAFLKNYCEPTRPQVIVTNRAQFEDALRLRREVSGMQGAKILLFERESGQELIDSKPAETNLYLVQELFDWREIDEKLIMKRVTREINPKVNNSVLMMTSGSTGRSKVVPWTHEKQLYDIWSIISATQNGLSDTPNAETGATSQRPLMPIGDDVVLAGDLPLDQGCGTVAMLWCLVAGHRYVLIKTNDEEQFCKDVTRFKLTANLGSSSFIYRLLKKIIHYLDHPPAESIDISSLKFITCTGCKVNIGPLMDVLRPVYKDLNVTQFYGATEVGFMAMLSCEDAMNSFDSVGYLFPGARAKVVDTRTNQSVGPGEEGEMLVKSPSLFDHYIPHPEEKLEDLMRNRKDKDGFYRTGDLVHYDSEQRFYIHARMQDTLFLDLDWKTSPSEIEKSIDKHPLVECSAVVGIPNPEIEGCVIPKAFIKLKTYEELEQFPTEPPEEYQRVRNLIKRLKSGRHDQIKEDIFNFIASELAVQKLPHGGITIVEDFPRIGGFHKIDRNQLMRMD